MKPSGIDLHIDELVLQGFSPGDSERIRTAFTAELHRLLHERGLPPGTGDAAVMPARAIAANPAHPESIGIDTARSVYGSFSTNAPRKPGKKAAQVRRSR